jgi:hypothetical protein
MARRRSVSQAWVESLSDDPEAISALEVARHRLAAGARLSSLRRLRLLELRGPLPGRGEQEELLHRSSRFYNPHKERCVLRIGAEDPAPITADEQVVLVWERGGERRSTAERWWLHETGNQIEVREGVAWALTFETREPAADRARELALLCDRRHGLFCNPHAQEFRLAGGVIPIPWLAGDGPVTRGRKR